MSQRKSADARPAAPALDVSYDVDDLGHLTVTAVVCSCMHPT